jgi:hypothetical protein
MRRQTAFTFCIAVCVLLTSDAASQEKVVSALIKPDTSGAAVTRVDTLALMGGTALSVIPQHSKSGTTAMLLSAVLPGAGQVYAHRYYTIPVIWGFGVFFGSQWVKANNVYRKYSSLFAESVQLDTLGHTGNDFWRQTRDQWHDYRDQFAIYMALTYILNIVDAYVGATLYSFDVSDNLGGSAAIRFRIPFR